MSLRKVASSVAFCCARAPTKVSNAPAIASATYSSQRQRSACLLTGLPVDAVIPYLLATRGRQFTGRCPNACRLRYCDFPCFASAHIRQLWTTPSNDHSTEFFWQGQRDGYSLHVLYVPSRKFP